MKAVCPNSPAHEEFITVATVTEDWKVDSDGNFLEVVLGGGPTVQGPCVENTWACTACGAEARVTR